MNIFRAMAARMGHNALALRTASQNIANLHTPHYQSRVPAPLALQQSPFHVALRRTHPHHFDLSQHGGNHVMKDPEAHANSLTGNNVSYTKELQRANAAAQHDKQIHNLFHTSLDMLTLALKR